MASTIKADTLQSTTSNIFFLNSVGTEYARFDSSGVFQLANSITTTFPAGTAALPSISTIGDTNTGIFFPAADTIAFAEGGVESMRIDSSGNVKLSAANTKILNSSGNPILQQTGSVLQVVSNTKTDTFSSSSTSFTDITGLSVSITPSSTSSKILVKIVLTITGTNTTGSTYRITRGGSPIGIADTASNRNRGSGAEVFNTRTDTSYNYGAEFLDSPSSISSLTYAVQAIVGSGTGTVFINRSSGDTDSAGFSRGVSSITVMEIAG